MTDRSNEAGRDGRAKEIDKASWMDELPLHRQPPGDELPQHGPGSAEYNEWDEV